MALSMNDIRKIIKEEVNIAVKKHLKNMVNEELIAMLVESRTKELVSESSSSGMLRLAPNAQRKLAPQEAIKQNLRSTVRQSLTSMVTQQPMGQRFAAVQAREPEPLPLEIDATDADGKPINLQAVPEKVLENIFNKDYKSFLKNMNEHALSSRKKLPTKLPTPEITPIEG